MRTWDSELSANSTQLYLWQFLLWEPIYSALWQQTIKQNKKDVWGKCAFCVVKKIPAHSVRPGSMIFWEKLSLPSPPLCKPRATHHSFVHPFIPSVRTEAPALTGRAARPRPYRVNSPPGAHGPEDLADKSSCLHCCSHICGARALEPEHGSCTFRTGSAWERHLTSDFVFSSVTWENQYQLSLGTFVTNNKDNVWEDLRHSGWLPGRTLQLITFISVVIIICYSGGVFGKMWELEGPLVLMGKDRKERKASVATLRIFILDLAKKDKMRIQRAKNYIFFKMSFFKVATVVSLFWV